VFSQVVLIIAHLFSSIERSYEPMFALAKTT
jgi:hypothetical protein